MKVYSISSLLEIANGDISISFPFLESFFGKYSQKVTEDRKTPLFSKTSKYSNFPVRCQWKGSNNGGSKKKRVNVNKGKDSREDKEDKWRTGPTPDDIPKLTPTKIQKVSGIRGLAMKVLNKITIGNFEKQSVELLKVLNENKENMSVKIIAELILEKIWYDKSFYELYVNLCKVLWEDNNWISECYQIKCIDNKYFYNLYFESDKSVKGPFITEEKAVIAAKKWLILNLYLFLCVEIIFIKDILLSQN